MPNWCHNVLRIKTNRVEDVLNDISVDGKLSFLKIKPMPDTVYTLGTNPYLDKMYNFVADRYFKNNMESLSKFTQEKGIEILTEIPDDVKEVFYKNNHYHKLNIFRIDIAEDLHLFVENGYNLIPRVIYFKNNKTRICEIIESDVPSSALLFTLTIKNMDTGVVLEKINCSYTDVVVKPLVSWYDWSIEEWGTKWDIGEDQCCIITDNVIVFQFDTAWTPPIGILEAITKIPHVEEIESVYYEPGFCSAGEFLFTKNGVHEVRVYSDEDIVSYENFIIEHGFESRESLDNKEE